MKRVCVIALGFCVVSTAWSAPTEQEALAMMERGAALMKDKGAAELMKRIGAKDPAFARTDLYIAMRDLYTGVLLADPVSPASVGRDIAGSTDLERKAYQRDVVEFGQVKGKGWLIRKAAHTADGHRIPGSTYVMRVNDVVLQVGLIDQ